MPHATVTTQSLLYSSALVSQVGIFTAWSTCTITAYLARVGGQFDSFEGHGLDITTMHLQPSTRALLAYLRVNVTLRASGNSMLLVPCFQEACHECGGLDSAS